MSAGLQTAGQGTSRNEASFQSHAMYLECRTQELQRRSDEDLGENLISNLVKTQSQVGRADMKVSGQLGANPVVFTMYSCDDNNCQVVRNNHRFVSLSAQPLKYSCKVSSEDAMDDKKHLGLLDKTGEPRGPPDTMSPGFPFDPGIKTSFTDVATVRSEPPATNEPRVPPVGLISEVTSVRANPPVTDESVPETVAERSRRATAAADSQSDFSPAESAQSASAPASLIQGTVSSSNLSVICLENHLPESVIPEDIQD